MKKLYRAPIIVPVVAPVIEDGAVLVENGRIITVGPYSDLKGRGELVQYDDSALVPALINAHCHLELSHLAALGREKVPPDDITGWIRELLARRMAGGEDILGSARQALAALYDSGVALVADIGNDPGSHAIGAGSPCRHMFFQEMIGGLTTKGQEDVLATLDQLIADGYDGIITGHAPYSTGAELLVRLKKRAGEFDLPISIHVGESRDELEFLATGKGPMADFLAEYGFVDSSFVPPAMVPVSYLDSLGLLDHQTLCVHCVHLTEEEISVLARRKARVCLCPVSNNYLGVGKAPVMTMLVHGLAPALGTDSLASNPDLSIWQEMARLRADQPDLAPTQVFVMATINGARALGAGDLGQLAAGARASFLAVDIPGTIKKDGVIDYLTSGGGEIRCHWASDEGLGHD